MTRNLTMALLVALLCAVSAHGDSLAQDVNQAFRDIGVENAQIRDYAVLYEEYLRSRSAAVDNILDANRETAELSGTQKRTIEEKLRQTADQSVQQMSTVLEEEQIPHYAKYLELANRLYLRESGL